MRSYISTAGTTSHRIKLKGDSLRREAGTLCAGGWSIGDRY